MAVKITETVSGLTELTHEEPLSSVNFMIWCRSSLLGENTEKILFLAYNIRLFGIKYWYFVALYAVWICEFVS